MKCLPQCNDPRHWWGKYTNCLAMALHEKCRSMVAWADEESGDSVDWHAYRWLIIGRDRITIPGNEWAGGWDISTVPGTFVILSEYPSGGVELHSFDSEAEARDAWDIHDQAYGLFLDSQEVNR